MDVGWVVMCQSNLLFPLCVHRFVIDMLHNVAISDICHNAVSAFLKQDTYGLMHEDMLDGIRENTPHSE